jgi:hypothetical protein
LIEGPAFAVGGIAIAGRVVVLEKRARSGFDFGQSVAKDPVAGERAHIVDAQRACLTGNLQAIIEIRRELSNPSEADCLEVQLARSSRLAPNSPPETPKGVGLNGGFWNDLAEGAVDAMQIVPVRSSIERAVSQVDDRRSERINPKILPSITGTDCIERTSGVGPIEMPNQTLLAKKQLLATDTKSELTALDIPEFHERLSNIECVFERWSVWFGIPAPDLAILALELKLHPIRGDDRGVDAGASEDVTIIGVGPESAAS